MFARPRLASALPLGLPPQPAPQAAFNYPPRSNPRPAYQCDSAPKYNTCYLTSPGNAVIVLQPERSGWYVWAGPQPAP